MLNLTKSLSKKLKKYPEILAVYLFGSSVYGKKGKLSDLDIGVLFHHPERIFSAPQKSLNLYEKLFTILSPLAPQVNKLDLVFLQRTPLTLQKEVILKGKLIYCQNQEKLLDYKEKVLLKYADIKPLLDQFYQEIYQSRL